MARFEELQNCFWTKLEEVVEEIEECGAEVLESSREYIVASYEDDGEDVQVEFRLSGTERTITIESFEEVYRG